MTKENKEQTQRQKPSYTGIGVALGAAFGFVLGLLIFDNVGLGMGLGAAAGIVIGSIADVQTKNKPSKKE